MKWNDPVTVCIAASRSFRPPDFCSIGPREASMTRSEKPIETKRYLVRGRVQGVGFRWFVEREAHLLGIAGWVRNNHDGSVEILAQGTRDQLSGLHSRLREGPRAARVDAVEVSDAPPVSGLSSFRIEGAW